MNKLNIALDYDDTYTADKTMWNQFLRMCWGRKYKVYIVTGRGKEDTNEDLENILTKVEDVIFTDGAAKKPFCKAMGIDINIWIDDKPERILTPNPWTEEEKEKWRANGRR